MRHVTIYMKRFINSENQKLYKCTIKKEFIIFSHYNELDFIESLVISNAKYLTRKVQYSV